MLVRTCARELFAGSLAGTNVVPEFPYNPDRICRNCPTDNRGRGCYSECCDGALARHRPASTMTQYRKDDGKISVLLADFSAADDVGLCSFLEGQPDIDVLGLVPLGSDVLGSVRQLAPDVVVVRAGESVFGGVETAFRIRMQQPEIRVVMVSSSLSPGNLMLALEAGVHGYVVAGSGHQAVVKAVRAAPAGAIFLSTEAADSLVAGYVQRSHKADQSGQLKRLSRREREVLLRLVDGESSTSIARDLGLSPKTVDTYRRRLMQKLGVNNMPALVKLALTHGLTTAA